ncbi:transcriptional regulator [Streptomyces sp. AC563]|uniref:transcriptional regulator n=1 Tax=Streptomyces buecherae TaxID=2763006 RepID=UPI00164E877E|nr:transcriptional regulator [Streptomyces buecherae]MBC3989207.1 transcriptional regulator [Streptomyces buecherae]
MAARPLVARQPNERLQALIQEAACSNAGLARRVNMCGAEHGLDLRYDKTSVARWLRGQQPRGRAPAVIAEALGRKLGRTVTIDEIGMAGGKNLASGVGLQFSPTVVGAIEQVCELWRSDVGRRDFLSGSTVAASALVEPSRDWLITSADPQVARTAGARVGKADVAAVRATTEALVALDHQYGSGHVRPVVVHYLNSVVSGLLAGSYRESVGRDLFAAVARLTELAGYMAVDTGQPGLAQRYYIQALRLARGAADVPLGGYVLASMSLQATYRGFADEGVDLAQAALERNRGLATARTMSFFRLVEARAQAKAGDGPACGAALRASEGWLERSRDGDPDPSWLDFYSYERFAADAAECYRDLKLPRQVRRFTERALACPTEEFVRSHGLRLVVSAVAELESGNLDAACAAGTRAVEVAGRISSARTTEYVRDLLHRLEPYGDEPRVVELRERARPLLVAPA